ncbi:hypothetical protein RB623_21395 [Mesorhizobium sp. LHD-90]|uniref:hypothetical protein n=1 Tax=Mesorhizobium sp. LHD-90 TaxID=3071414 RepID=UPI0027DF827C|nr:hypothetical protein [Mesorhizobium sp. LHD-90]MDQ6436613.1 hypothetical protein [Mesorhizobium sp. LHD-90]
MNDKYPELWPAGFDARWHGKSIPQRDWHFHRQLLARYGIVLAAGEFASMLRDIKHGAALPMMKLTPRKVIYSVRIERVRARVYVASDGLQIFTAWPPKKKLNEIRRKMSYRD